ncbi:MAG: phosphatidylglycerophosphatase A [Myxococcota bacterium]|nr:phosphatidylglycerophosphatase A [Myxococcota bacterium]
MSRAGRKLAWTLATWFGCGRVPKLPGTIGALGAIPLYLLAMRAGRAGVAVTAVVVIVTGVWAASVVARDLGLKDPQIIVVDEVAGVLVTMLPIRHASLSSVAIGFALFRLFDIAKPWPVRSLERLPGGWGIVLDDVGAGILGAAALVLLQMARVLP